jgi:hypothetical protein
MRWFIGLIFMGFTAGLVLGLILMTTSGHVSRDLTRPDGLVTLEPGSVSRLM